MTILSPGPCNLDGWEIDTTCFDVPDGTTPETIERWRRIAAEQLYHATGMRFGESCPETVRPCARKCFDYWSSRLNFWPAGYNGSPWIPYIGADGEFRNASICGCPSKGCHCGPELCEIELPGPIFRVVQISWGPVTVDPHTYSFLDGRFLVRDSRATTVQPELPGCWPSCQDMSKPPSAEDTFTVSYTTGVALPFMASAALTQLTAHYIRGCGNGCGCGAGTRRNLSRLQRQGVELDFFDGQQILTEGRTGIEIVDQFIATYNPGKLPRAMRVRSPDSPQRPRIWTGP